MRVTRNRFKAVIFSFGLVSSPSAQIEQWGVFEAELMGPASGNPFLDVTLEARFTDGIVSYTAGGFYDGAGRYKIRFMPPNAGKWTYVTTSSAAGLSGQSGSFTAAKPSAGNHGPVQVADTYHFKHADGKRFYPVGTTLYCWQLERYDETLETLSKAKINKVRFMPFPHGGNRFPPFKPWEGSENSWDYDRPNPGFWRFTEGAVRALDSLGVQADFIFFHPYESGNRRRWGLGPEAMTEQQRKNLLRYIVRRMAAYKNVWWSMANEYDLINKGTSYWEPLAKVVADEDPYDHPHSIHGLPNTHYPGWTNPWVTHISIQSPRVGDISKWRTQYGKPVLDDEYQYEGNIGDWGNLSGQEASHRMWTCALQGGYGTHGESQSPYSFFWKGGTPALESWKRVNWMSEELYRNGNKPLPGGLSNGGPDFARATDDYYLYYFGSTDTEGHAFSLTRGVNYKVDVMDTWNMTVKEEPSTFSGNFVLTWPRSKYMAVRIYNPRVVASHAFRRPQKRQPAFTGPIRLLDVRGRFVGTLDRGRKSPGWGYLEFDPPGP